MDDPGPARGREALRPSSGRPMIGSLVVLVWSIPGLIVNPDFAIGDAATSERVLGWT